MAVEFTSYGYDTAPGTGLGELVWQEMHPQIGTSYGVRSPDDWKVTAVSGADRTVSIAAGRGWGYGVIDKTVANDTIQLDTVASGSRWDLISCRRDPTPSAGVSSFIKINGGTSPVIPGARLSGPGIHDQPLFLVQVTAGQTQPTGFIDCRTWSGAGGGMIANDPIVLSFLNTAGTRINIKGADWIREVGTNGVLEWKEYRFDKSINGGAHVGLTALQTGWTRPFTAGSSKPRVWSTDGVTANVTGVVQFNAGGARPIIGIPAEFAPLSSTTLTYVGTTQASNGPSNPTGGPTLALGIQGGILQTVYETGTIPIGSYVPLTGSWLINS